MSNRILLSRGLALTRDHSLTLAMTPLSLKAGKEKKLFSFFLFFFLSLSTTNQARKGHKIKVKEPRDLWHQPKPQPSTQLKGALLCFVVSKELSEA